jgi:hypothetical protein
MRQFWAWDLCTAYWLFRRRHMRQELVFFIENQLNLDRNLRTSDFPPVITCVHPETTLTTSLIRLL